MGSQSGNIKESGNKKNSLTSHFFNVCLYQSRYTWAGYAWESSLEAANMQENGNQTDHKQQRSQSEMSSLSPSKRSRLEIIFGNGFKMLMQLNKDKIKTKPVSSCIRHDSSQLHQQQFSIKKEK